MTPEELRQKITRNENNLSVATALGIYTTRAWYTESINLCEAMMLKDYHLVLERQVLQQKAHRSGVSRSDLLELMVVCATADWYDKTTLRDKYRNWTLEAFAMLGEKRAHFTDQLVPLVEQSDFAQLRQALTQHNTSPRPFDKGPYPREVFPGMLVWDAGPDKAAFAAMELSEEVIDLLVFIDVEVS